MRHTHLIPGFLPVLLAAQPVPTPREAAARSYVEAFNQGAEAMSAWLKAHVSPEGLQRRPLEARMAVYGQMRSELGRLELERVEPEGADGVALLVKHGDARSRLTMGFDAAGTLAGLRIEDAEPPAAAGETSPLSLEAFAREVEAGLAERAAKGEFQGTVLLARGERVLLHQGYGLAQREFKVPNGRDTTFNLGSINKLFTKVAIAQLAAEGKVGFDDPLAKFLPDYPDKAAAAKIRVRHLLDMSSGVGDVFGPAFDAANKEGLRALKDYLPFFAGKALAFEPGAGRAYSNGGYVLLGLIVEKASGMDYFTYVKTRIFDPAGMRGSGSFAVDEVVPDRAEGYLPDGRKNVYTKPARGSSAGGGYATAPDLLRFSRALQAGKLLPPGLTAWVLGPGPTPADAKPPVPPDFRPGFGIAGGSPGQNAVLDISGPEGLTAIVLCNGEPPMAERTARWIRGLWARVKA
ncbi:MAG: serine hydrolase domain-containing protein [Holophagaceae bacterium]